MPTQLTLEELIKIRELFTPPYRTNWQDGQKLFGHIEARELAFKEALQSLLHLPSREDLTGKPSSYDGESRDEAEADYQTLIRAAAAKLNIILD